MAGPIPYLIAVAGGAIIRATARTLPRLLARFKNSKQIKNPSKAQVDDAKRLTDGYTNFSKSQQKLLKKNDTAKPTVTQSLTGTGRNPNQIASNRLGGVRKTGEGRRINVKGIAKGVVIGGVTVGAGAAAIYAKLNSAYKKKAEKMAKEAASKAALNTQIEMLLRQQKKEEAAKNKPLPRPKNLVRKGAVLSSKPPLKRPKNLTKK